MGDGNYSNCAGILPPEIKEMLERNLTTFDGTREKWLFFKNQFIFFIHNEVSFTSIEKHRLLLNLLKGEALSAVDFEPNYETAWNSLIQRYDDKELLTNIHLKSLLHELPQMKEQSQEGLRHIINEVNKNKRCLQLLGHPVEHWDTIIIFAVCSKLDPETHRHWLCHNIKDEDKTESGVDKLLNFLKKRLEIWEVLKLHDKTEYNPLGCPLCHDDHLIFCCPNFLELDPRQRFREIKRIQLCSNCLRNDHETKHCSCDGCQKCGRKHHSLLHFS